MLSAGEKCIDKNEIIEKTWKNVLENWINRCMKPKIIVSELNDYCFSEVMKRYDKDLSIDETDISDFTDSDIEAFLGRHYPKLTREMEACGRAKRLYIAMTAVLYHFCTNDKSGNIVADIFEVLEKNDKQMILNVCEGLKLTDITPVNIESAIKDAYNRIYTKENKPEYEVKMVLQIPDKEITGIQPTDIHRKKRKPATKSKTKLYDRKNMKLKDKGLLDAKSYLEMSGVDAAYLVETKRESDHKLDSLDDMDDRPINSESPDEDLLEMSVQDSVSECVPSCNKALCSRNFYGDGYSTQSSGSERSRDRHSSKDSFTELRRTCDWKLYCALGGMIMLAILIVILCSISLRGWSEKTDEVETIEEAKPEPSKPKRDSFTELRRTCDWKLYCALGGMIMLAILIVILCSISLRGWSEKTDEVETIEEAKPEPSKPKRDSFTELRRTCDWKLYCALGGMIMLAILIVILCSISLRGWSEKTDEVETIEEAKPEPSKPKRLDSRTRSNNIDWEWQCIDQFCVKAHVDKNLTIYKSLSRCTLSCMGPQLWPYPIGYIHFSKKIVALTTTGIEYKFQSVPSEIVHTYLAEAFKLFLKGLFRLEKIDKKQNRSQTIDLDIKRISVSIEVENDPEPRLKLNTEESYMLNFETVGSRVMIKVISGSFCGVRHGLETASQLILLDQATGYLLSHSDLTIKDAPSYRYRGIMLDTGRNYISVTDIMRTVDAMAACKLNTLHWRISSETSFPLYLPQLPLLYEYGAYDRTLMYTKHDVKSIVKKAAIRGIRVLIEVTAPGPVGRAWSWTSEATCPKKTDNYTCDNILCTRLLMEGSVFDALEFIYSEILQMTGVDDIFHLSDGMFSMTNCYQLISDRDGFLERALERLKIANKGFLPKLPIIWYTSHLMKDSEARTWDKMGVQLYQWDPNPGEQFLGKFRVIHSTKWDLSCEISKHRCVKFKTWQEMYSWKSWRSIEVFNIEGGEAILWTDLIGSGNLDITLWPRAAAVAERLWSDMTANSTANRYVYVRLDTHRWRMLLRGIKVQPIWPAWCSFNPSECVTKIGK